MPTTAEVPEPVKKTVGTVATAMTSTTSGTTE
jgi:hypothetical protein